MRSTNVALGETIFSGDVNGLRGDAQGAATLSAHQVIGKLALTTNPTDGQTATFTVNGTAIVVRFKNTIAAANDVKIQGTAALTSAALLTFLTNPQLTTANQIAATAANQQLLSYLWFNNVTTTTFIGSMNKTTDANLTSFACSTTVTSGVYTGNTMTLFVQGGVVMVAGTQVKFAGGLAPTVTAPASNPRIDVLTIDNAGTLAWTTGVEGSSPAVPAYPINKVPIVEVWNVVAETILEDNDNQVTGQGFVNFDVRPMVGTSFNPAAIGASLIPDADGTRDLGSLSLEWNNIYAKSNVFVAGVGVASAKFGGSGADGALTQTSGTTTLAVGGAYYFVKNYTSISLTSTANLTISGVGSNGCILVLKSQGNVTLTSSGTVINMAGMGGQPSSNRGASSLGVWPSQASGGGNGTNSSSTQGPAPGGVAGNADIATMVQVGKHIPLTCGGAGGAGGFTTFPGTSAGGGGGGGGGTLVVVYKTLTANTGTVSITGGGGCTTSGSSSAVCPGGAGGGAIYIECGGAFNFTTGTISVAGLFGGTGATGGSPGNGTTGGSGTGGTAGPTSNSQSSGGGGGSGSWNAADGGSSSSGQGSGGASGNYYFGANSNMS